MVSSVSQICPKCRRAVAADALVCACGAPAVVSFRAAHDEMQREADALHEEFLAAKLRMAKRVLADAVAALAAAPEDRALDARVSLAAQEVSRVLNEIAVRRKRAQVAAQSRSAATGDEVPASPADAFRAAQLAKAVQAIRLSANGVAKASGAAPTMEAVTAGPAQPVETPPSTATVTPALQQCQRCGAKLGKPGAACGCAASAASRAADDDGFLTHEERLALRQGVILDR